MSDKIYITLFRYIGVYNNTLGPETNKFKVVKFIFTEYYVSSSYFFVLNCLKVFTVCLNKSLHKQ